METLTYQAKIAILRVLVEIMNVDNIIHDNEKEYLSQAKQKFGLDDNSDSEVNNLEIKQALEIVGELEPNQKSLVAQMMGKMIVIDQDINYNEVILYNDICYACDINDEFHVDDYQGYTLSSPFVNPEDL